MTWSDEEIYLVMERAHSLATQGLYAEAAQIFAGVVALDASNRYARTALVALLLMLDEPASALAFAEDGLRAAPADFALRAGRAEALMALGRFGDAQQEVRWLEEQGDDAEPAARLGMRLAAGDQKLAPARATFESGSAITNT